MRVLPGHPGTRVRPGHFSAFSMLRRIERILGAVSLAVASLACAWCVSSIWIENYAATTQTNHANHDWLIWLLFESVALIGSLLAIRTKWGRAALFVVISTMLIACLPLVPVKR